MSVWTIRQWLTVSALALASASFAACGSDDKDSGGGKTDAGVDAGENPEKDAGELPMGALQCGSNVCKPLDLAFVGKAEACCTGADKDVCGAKPPASLGFGTDCIALGQPGAESATCSEFWDKIDTYDADNGLTVFVTDDAGMPTLNDAGMPNVRATVPGCCTPQGFCGLQSSKITSPAAAGLVIDYKFGCIAFSDLPPNAGGPLPAGANPFCQIAKPDEPACPLALGEEGCAPIVAAGGTCDPVAPPEDWICQSLKLPRADGKPVAPTTDCMKGLPKYAQGCGLTVQNPGGAATCISYVDDGVFGCETIALDTTGARDCLTGVPEFLSGCGADKEPSAENPTCLRLTPEGYGCVDVTDAKDIRLAAVPEYLCGCGNAKAFEGGIPCLSYVDTELCGAVEVTGDDPLPGLPSQLCGCEEGGVAGSCLPNIPKTICGAVTPPPG